MVSGSVARMDTIVYIYIYVHMICFLATLQNPMLDVTTLLISEVCM